MAYPASLDELTIVSADGTVAKTNHAALHNNANDAINRIQLALGLNPQAASADLATRLGTVLTGAQYERYALREGFPEKFWPALNGLHSFWKPQASNTVNIANSAHLLRFEAPRKIICRGLSIVVSTIATANDELAVVMKDETGKKTLAVSPSTAGKLNGSTGRQDIDFEADVTLEAGKVYYPGVQFKTVGGTAAFLATSEVSGSSAVGSVFGSTPPNSFMGAPTTTYPWVGEPAFSNSQNRVYVIVRER